MSRYAILPFLILLAGGTACDGALNPAEEQPVAVTFTAVGNRTAIAADTTRLADSLIITRVQVVMSELELARTTGDTLCTVSSRGSGGSGGDDNSGKGKGKGEDNKKKEEKAREERHNRCPEIELGPFLVNLALTTSPVARFANSIPEGVYREIEFEIDKPDSDSAGVAFVAKNPDFRDISVRAEGTYRGRAFTYAGRAKAELELEFRPSLTVGKSGTVVDIRVDLARWFRGSDGKAVDPATANPGGVNAALVARNIGSSFSLATGS
jgi:hypothetical protein